MSSTTRQRLISTKLHPPTLTRNNILRALAADILVDRVDQSAYVVATTGFGKSTLLRQIYDRLSAQDVTCGWLSLDRQDSNPAVFLGYFCELMSKVGVIDTADVFQQTSLTDASGVDLAFLLLREAAAAVTAPVAIFLDDLQFITDDRTVSGLSAFLDAKSDNLRVFFAARHTPDLQMQRREMNGSFLRVDHSSLKFNQQEAEQFFEASQGRNPRPADIAQVLTSTEGWPAGLQIATISQSSSPGTAGTLPRRFSGASDQVSAYLTESIFKSLPPEIQDFVLATGPLNRFCAPLCGSVRGRDGNEAAIEWLLDKNLFIMAIDSSGNWYRYHHMFSDFLVTMAQKTGGYDRSEICRRASIWCLENGLVDEAIDYLLSIGDFDAAAAQIARASPRIARQDGDTVTMIRWVESLPKAHRVMHPEMMLDYAFSLTFSLATDRAQSIVREVRAALRNGETPVDDVAGLLAFADTVSALALAARDMTKDALHTIAETRRKWVDAEPSTQGILSNIAAYCHMTRNQHSDAAKEISTARTHGLRSGVGYVSIWADCIDVMTQCRSGTLEGARRPLARARSDASVEGESDLLRLLVHMLAADVAYLSGDLVLAQAELAKGTGFSASFGPAEPLLISHRIRAWCAALTGHSARAMEATEHGIALGLRHGIPRLSFFLIGQQVALLSRDGKADAAREVAARWGGLDDSWKTRFLPETENMQLVHKKILAELAICEGRFDEASTTIHLLERRLKTTVSLADATRLKILKAHALARQDRGDEAARETSQAAKLAGDSGAVAPFLEYGAYAKPLLQDLINRRLSVDTPASMVKASIESQLLGIIAPERLDPEQDDHADDTPLEPLTEREADLLRLAEGGMTNAQIAAHLVIKEATVKWHLHNAFQKLGVRNRMGALAAARKYGLID